MKIQVSAGTTHMKTDYNATDLEDMSYGTNNEFLGQVKLKEQSMSPSRPRRHYGQESFYRNTCEWTFQATTNYNMAGGITWHNETVWSA